MSSLNNFSLNHIHSQDASIYQLLLGEVLHQEKDNQLYEVVDVCVSESTILIEGVSASVEGYLLSFDEFHDFFSLRGSIFYYYLKILVDEKRSDLTIQLNKSNEQSSSN